MGKYKKILVGYDGSASGENALLQSFRLAADEKAWITVATVIPEYTGELDLTVGNVHQALIRQGRDLLTKASDAATREGALIKTVLEEGEVYERLVDLAEEQNCSVILIGTRGQSSPRTVVGSATARVIGHTQRDILVVPAGTKIGWGTILLATDGSRYSQLASERAIDLAKSYGGSLSAVSVVDVPTELYGEAPDLVEDLGKKARGYVGQVRTKALAEGITAEAFVGEGETYQAVLKVAAEKKADLIVMGSHGRTGLKRLLMGSVTEKVIASAPCPVLVVKS